jgi:DNA-binding transcriptional MerR regulator
MRIGELSRRLGVTDSLIRRYEDLGLLPPRNRVNGSRQREYDRADVERLILIRSALRFGISMNVLVSVIRFLDGGDPPEAQSVDLARQALRTTETRLRQVLGLRDVLAAFVLAAGPNDGHSGT